MQKPDCKLNYLIAGKNKAPTNKRTIREEHVEGKGKKKARKHVTSNDESDEEFTNRPREVLQRLLNEEDLDLVANQSKPEQASSRRREKTPKYKGINTMTINHTLTNALKQLNENQRNSV